MCVCVCARALSADSGTDTTRTSILVSPHRPFDVGAREVRAHVVGGTGSKEPREAVQAALTLDGASRVPLTVSYLKGFKLDSSEHLEVEAS